MGQESDWKKLQSLIPMLRERFLAEKNTSLAKSLTEDGRTATERFWDTQKRMEEISKVLRNCLDDQTPSTMDISMLIMVQVGMLVQEDLSVFSDELRGKLKQVFD